MILNAKKSHEIQILFLSSTSGSSKLYTFCIQKLFHIHLYVNKLRVWETSYLQVPELFKILINAHSWLPSLEQLSFYFSKMGKFRFVEKVFSNNLPASLTLVDTAKLKNHIKIYYFHNQQTRDNHATIHWTYVGSLSASAYVFLGLSWYS